MAALLKPWEIHPGLWEERLRAVAALIRDVRAAAAAEYDPERGDTPWSLGCTIYSRTCYRIAQASVGTDYSGWLSIVEDDGLKFVFAVGGVPFKIFRGEEEGRAPHRTLRRSFAELEAQQLAFLEDDATSERSVRLMVETDADGYATAITFVQVDAAGAIHNPWSIPIDGATTMRALPTRTEGVALPPPAIGGRRAASESETANS